MKKYLIALAAFLVVTTTVQATPISWDLANNVVRLLAPAATSTVRVHSITATSTTATSTFPVASTTTFCIGTDCRTSWPTSTSSSASSTNEWDLFIIAGQSNAVASAGVIASSTVAPAGIIKSFYNGTIKEVTNDLDPGNGGPWPAFGLRYYQLTGRKVAFVHTAVGGTGLNATSSAGDVEESWGPEGTLFGSSTLMTDQAIAAYEATGMTVNVKGVLWSQGEQDATFINALDETAAQYRASLENLIARYRGEYGTSTPFYIFRTGTHVTASDSGYRQVRQEQENVAASDPNTYVVWRDSIDYVRRGMMYDNVHYDQYGYNDMGRIGAEGVVMSKSEPHWYSISNALIYNPYASSSGPLFIGQFGNATSTWASTTFGLNFGDTRFYGRVGDSTGATGTAGQLLSVTATGSTLWINASSSGGGLASTDIDTSAEIAAIVTDELGTGKLVFASSTTLSQPLIEHSSAGAAATSVAMTINDNTNSNAWSLTNWWGGLQWKTNDLGALKTNFVFAPTMTAISGNTARMGLFSADGAAGTLTEKWSFDESGNTGFGTTTPESLLHIYGSNNATKSIIVQANNAGSSADPFINFRVGATTQNYSIGIDNSNSDALTITNGIGTSAGTALLTILTGGNVGIGTTSPATALSVVGTTTTTNLDVTTGLRFGGVTGTAWTDFCLSIHGTAGLCDGVDDTAAGGSGLATTAPWTVNEIAQVASNGAVKSIATSSLGLSPLFTTSASLAALISDETGTGSFVLSAAPTLTGTTTVGGLSIGSLSGILKGVAGAVVTVLVDLANDVTGTLGVGNGGTGATTLDNLITLATHTTGNFIATITGTANEITVSGSGSENAAVTISLPSTLDISGKTVKQKVYRSFTVPGFGATTTSATTTIPLGPALVAETWNTATCKTTSGSINWVFKDDSANLMNAQNASSSYGVRALSTNNTFTAGEGRNIDIGPITNAQLTCSVEITVN